jgi:molybdopterin/thiamine biosynthesis adenylyltransferase
LRTSTILIAGCGSIGGSVVEPLVRLGAERLMLAEPDGYDLHNLNRQSARLQDLGRNKAEVLQERLRDINPYASIEVHSRGIVPDNVEALLARAALVVDGVDVTNSSARRNKVLLHEQARRFGLPVVSGYDIAGLQLLQIYDYRSRGVAALDGRVSLHAVDRLDTLEFLERIIPKTALPHEMIPELRRRLAGEQGSFPQLVYTAQLFGVLAARVILDLLAGRAVQRRVMVDVCGVVRPAHVRLKIGVARLLGLFRLSRELRAARRGRKLATLRQG